MCRSILVATVGALALALGLVWPAAAQIAPPGVFTVVPFQGPIDQQFTITGWGYGPGTTLDHYFVAPDGQKFSYTVRGRPAVVAIDADGKFAAPVAPGVDFPGAVDGTWRAVFCRENTDECTSAEFVLGASLRKGGPNPNADPIAYLTDIQTDLQAVTGAMAEVGAAFDDANRTGPVEKVAALERGTATIDAVYQRQIARDYPPQLKAVDDNYTETLRAATRAFQALLEAARTGEQQYLAQAQIEMDKFNVFLAELLRLLV